MTVAIPIVGSSKGIRPVRPLASLIQTDDHTFESLACLVKELDSNDDLYRSRVGYKYPKNPSHRPTTEDLSPYFVRTRTNPSPIRQRKEAIVRHDRGFHLLRMQARIPLVRLNPMQRLQVNTTCVLRRHYHVT